MEVSKKLLEMALAIGDRNERLNSCRVAADGWTLNKRKNVGKVLKELKFKVLAKYETIIIRIKCAKWFIEKSDKNLKKNRMS